VLPPDWREVDPDEQRKNPWFALEPVFEDCLMERWEGDEDEGVWCALGACKKTMTMGGRTLGEGVSDLDG